MAFPGPIPKEKINYPIECHDITYVIHTAMRYCCFRFNKPEFYFYVNILTSVRRPSLGAFIGKFLKQERKIPGYKIVGLNGFCLPLLLTGYRN